MAFFNDAQETARRYEKQIAEFRELFRANEVGFGAQEDFFRLAPLLARDSSFRDEFTARVKSVQQREDGRLALTEMLTIVGVASGGTEIEKTGDEGAVPVSLLVVFLAGLGGWEETRALETAAESGSEDRQAAEAELEQRLAADQKEDVATVATSLFGGPKQVKDALSRLEMNTLQMKMHLDSIDSRMERMAPNAGEGKAGSSARPDARSEDSLEESEAMEPVPAPPMKPWPRPGEDTPRPEWMASAPPMRPWPAEKERDLDWKRGPGKSEAPPRANWPVKEAEPVWKEPMRQSEPVREESPVVGGRTLASGAAPLRWQPEFAAEDDVELPIRVPFEEYLEQKGGSRGRRVFAVGLVVVVIAAAVAGGVLYRVRGWQGIRDVAHTAGVALANGRARVAGWTSTPQKTTSVASVAAQPSVSTAAQAATAAGPAETTVPAQTAAPSPTPTAEPVQTAPVSPPPVTKALPKPDDANVATGTRDRESARAAPDAVRGVVSVLAGSGAASESSPSTLPKGMHSSVPVFVDEARLSVLSGPRPDYPRDALARGITGDVVVQANIGRNGEVESTQIVSGPAGLLKASLDAARQWRFRPCMVQGAPVECRTYIRFRYATEE